MWIARNLLSSSTVAHQIIEQENRGLPSARNAGIHAATGKYVCFIDADDMISDCHLGNLFELAEREGLEFAFSGFEYTRANHRQGSRVSPSAASSVIDVGEIQRGHLYRDRCIHCCALLLKKEFLEQEELYFNEALRFGEDAEYLWRLLNRVEKGGYVSSRSYKYLIHDGSLMSSPRLDYVERFFHEFGQTVSRQPFAHQITGEQVFARVSFGIFHSFAKGADWRSAKEMLKKVGYKQKLKNIRKVKDVRIRALSGLMRVSPYLFWKIAKLI